MSTAQAESFSPGTNKTLLIIGQDQETIRDYLKNTDIFPAGFMIYTSIQEIDGLSNPSVDRGAGIHYGQLYVKRYPHSTLQIGLYMVGALDDIVNGKYDKNIDLLAKWISRTNRPVYLRIGYEFDLAENQYYPRKYIEAYRYIVDRINENEVDNVSFVWHSALHENQNEDFMNWYPGDEYVDWFGISFFNIMQYKRGTEFSELAKKHNKPLMIAESSPAGNRTVRSRAQWFRIIFKFIEEHDVRAFCYINSNWDAMEMFTYLKWGDQRIENDKEILELWLEEILKDRYIVSSEDLFGIINYE